MEQINHNSISLHWKFHPNLFSYHTFDEAVVKRKNKCAKNKINPFKLKIKCVHYKMLFCLFLAIVMKHVL